VGQWIILFYLIVGAILAFAWTALGKRWLEGGALGSFVIAVFLWPFFLFEEWQSSPAREIPSVRAEFQRLAQMYPDIAYRWMRNDPDAWLLIEPESPEEIAFKQLRSDPSDASMFPFSFKLKVPMLGGKEITAFEQWDPDLPFGSSSGAWESESRFVDRYGDRPDQS
jgi:hypothetical protein